MCQIQGLLQLLLMAWEDKAGWGGNTLATVPPGPLALSDSQEVRESPDRGFNLANVLVLLKSSVAMYLRSSSSGKNLSRSWGAYPGLQASLQQQKQEVHLESLLNFSLLR
jgi:hypothetical protein